MAMEKRSVAEVLPEDHVPVAPVTPPNLKDRLVDHLRKQPPPFAVESLQPLLNPLTLQDVQLWGESQ